jgi:hypothetical protein
VSKYITLFLPTTLSRSLPFFKGCIYHQTECDGNSPQPPGSDLPHIVSNVISTSLPRLTPYRITQCYCDKLLPSKFPSVKRYCTLYNAVSCLRWGWVDSSTYDIPYQCGRRQTPGGRTFPRHIAVFKVQFRPRWVQTGVLRQLGFLQELDPTATKDLPQTRQLPRRYSLRVLFR